MFSVFSIFLPPYPAAFHLVLRDKRRGIVEIVYEHMMTCSSNVSMYIDEDEIDMIRVRNNTSRVSCHCYHRRA